MDDALTAACKKLETKLSRTILQIVEDFSREIDFSVERVHIDQVEIRMVDSSPTYVKGKINCVITRRPYSPEITHKN